MIDKSVVTRLAGPLDKELSTSKAEYTAYLKALDTLSFKDIDATGAALKTALVPFKLKKGDEDVFDLYHSYNKTKALYVLGEFNAARKQAKDLLDDLVKTHPDLKKLASRKKVTEVVMSLEDKDATISEVEVVAVKSDIIVYFLKIKVQYTRACQKLGLLREAQTSANEIIEFVRIFTGQNDLAEKFYTSAIKAAEATCDLLTTAKEFNAAFEIVNNVAEAIALRINKKYGKTLGVEEQDSNKPVEKKLADSHYSFAVRRLRAKIHLAFSEVNEAGSQLEELLKDELEFYNLKAPESAEKIAILDELNLP